MSDDLLEDLRAVLTLVDPVPAAVRRAAETVLHRPEEAAAATAAVRYPFDRVVGMGYFPNELGLPVAPPAHAAAPPGDA
jgi:hypothetical protein